MRTFALLALLALANAQVYRLSTYRDNVAEFADGLLKGLEKDPSSPDACYDALTKLEPEIGTVVQDFEAVIQSANVSTVTKLVTDVRALAGSAGQISSCDFAGLASAVQALTTSEGQAAATARVFANIFKLSGDVTEITNCASNYENCGQGTGDLAQIILGWGI